MLNILHGLVQNNIVVHDGLVKSPLTSYAGKTPNPIAGFVGETRMDTRTVHNTRFWEKSQIMISFHPFSPQIPLYGSMLPYFQCFFAGNEIGSRATFQRADSKVPAIILTSCHKPSDFSLANTRRSCLL